jgi:hypothetical protein
VSGFTVYDLRRWVRRIVLWTVLVAFGAAALVYCVDFVVFRARVATKRDAYGSVLVSHYYAVMQKNGKTQFIFDPPQAENCANALFPHGGFSPCWYLRRHPEQRTDI